MLTGFWDSLSILKRLYSQMLEPVCAQYGVTRMELDILLFLANNPSYDTATDIVNRRQLTKSHVSVSIKNLEQLGFLERTYAPENRKTAHLKLLPASAPVIARGKEVQNQFFSITFQGFTKRQIQTAASGFRRIADNARQAIDEES